MRVKLKLIRSWAWLGIALLVAIALLITSLKDDAANSAKVQASVAKSQVSNLRTQNLAACHRGNKFRRGANNNSANSEAEKNLIIRLGNIEAINSASRNDEILSVQSQAIVTQANNLKFKLFALTNCEAVYTQSDTSNVPIP